MCRKDVTNLEKKIAYYWGVTNDKVVKTVLYKYVGTSTITISEQLTFIEYIDIWFSGNHVFDQEDWGFLIKYIEYDPEIFKIFKKMTLETDSGYVTKSKIPENIEIKKEYNFYRFVFNT
jgi:hypothetical protein